MPARSGLDSRRFFTRVYGTDHIPPTAVPDPDLTLRPSGLAFSGGLATSWTSDEGHVFTPTAGMVPKQGGPSLNGYDGALFDVTGGRFVFNDEIVSGTSNNFTFACMHWPHNALGAGDREYLCYIANNSDSATNHVVFPHQSNQLDTHGVFTNPWHYIPGSTPIHRPQRIMYTYDGSIARVYRDGEFLGQSASEATAAKFFSYLNIGSAYGAVVDANARYRGAMYDIRFWNQVLSSDHAAADATNMRAQFGYDPDDVYPEDVSPSTITLRLDSRGKYTNPTLQFDGTNLAIWTDYSGNSRTGTQSTPGAYPIAGSYFNGHPSVRIGGTKWMGITANLSQLFGTGSDKTYDVKLMVKANSITSTQATAAWLRDVVLGDLGDFWSIHLFNNSGVPSVGLYHYALATYVLSSPISIGTPFLAHATYNGTIATLQVDDDAIQSVACGSVSGLATQVNIGYAAGAVIADADVADITVRNAVDSATMLSDRSYYSRIYGVDV